MMECVTACVFGSGYEDLTIKFKTKEGF